MEILWFIAQVVGVIAWPTVVIIIALVIRNDLRKIDKQRQEEAEAAAYYYDNYC